MLFINSVPKLMPTFSLRTQSEGSSFTAFCALEEGSLPVFFEWAKNGQNIKHGSGVSFKIDNSKRMSTLTIDEIVRTDSANYSCFVKNSVGSDAQNVQLFVKGLQLF